MLGELTSLMSRGDDVHLTTPVVCRVVKKKSVGNSEEEDKEEEEEEEDVWGEEAEGTPISVHQVCCSVL